jgi:excisionase family DNA binding protein
MKSRNGQRFSPAQLAPIVGVSESTLKRWIDAGHLEGEKTLGGHRKISLPHLLAFLRSRGRAAPSLEALGLLAEPHASPATPEELAGLLLRGDTDVARTLVLEQFRLGRALDELLDRLVAPAMVSVGTQWVEGKIDVCQEHVATLRAWSILVELRGLLPMPPDRAPLALGGSPEGDPYLLPTLMAELTLADMGWRTLNTGPNTPVASLLEAVTRYRPRIVWLSVTSVKPDEGFFEDYPRFFEAAQAAGASVVIGGQGLTATLQDRLVASGFGTRLAHLKAFARSRSSSPRPGLGQRSGRTRRGSRR